MLIPFKKKRGRPRKTREQRLEHYRLRYGSFFLHLIDQLAEDPLLTGADIAREIGVSREIVRIVCDIYYYKGFLKERASCEEASLYRKKTTLTREKTFRKFLKVLKDLGLWPITPKNYHVFTLPDGTTVSFRLISGKPRNYACWGNNTYIRVPISTPRISADFYVVALKNQKDSDFYIFPQSFVAGISQIYLRVGKPCKYDFFKNAWHLLTAKDALTEEVAG